MKNKKYPDNFMQMISDEKLMKELTWGSCVKITGKESGTGVIPYYELWRKNREFITDAINGPGSILDIGCANGFLLYCLLVWSDYEHIPYGIDTQADLIRDAQNLFPDYKDNFVTASVDELNELSDLPKDFKFIYWNLWDNFELDDSDNIALIRSILNSVKQNGRLILGFYDDEELAENRIADLIAAGLAPDGKLENKEGRGRLVWLGS